MYTRTQKLIYSEQGAKLRKTGTEDMLYFKRTSTIQGQPITAMWGMRSQNRQIFQFLRKI